MKSTALPVIAVCIAIWGAYYLGEQHSIGLYGIAIAATAMPMPCRYATAPAVGTAAACFGLIGLCAGGLRETAKTLPPDRKDWYDWSG
jgi:K(+)-stimulated pyrophosphate-energized sodium pump